MVYNERQRFVLRRRKDATNEVASSLPFGALLRRIRHNEYFQQSRIRELSQGSELIVIEQRLLSIMQNYDISSHQATSHQARRHSLINDSSALWELKIYGDGMVSIDIKAHI